MSVFRALGESPPRTFVDTCASADYPLRWTESVKCDQTSSTISGPPERARDLLIRHGRKRLQIRRTRFSFRIAPDSDSGSDWLGALDKRDCMGTTGPSEEPGYDENSNVNERWGFRTAAVFDPARFSPSENGVTESVRVVPSRSAASPKGRTCPATSRRSWDDRINCENRRGCHLERVPG